MSEYPRQGKPWKHEETINFRLMYSIWGWDVYIIADILARSPSAIKRRAVELKYYRPLFVLQRRTEKLKPYYNRNRSVQRANPCL